MRKSERAREGGKGWSGEMFLCHAMILLADSHDVSLVKNIIVGLVAYKVNLTKYPLAGMGL